MFLDLGGRIRIKFLVCTDSLPALEVLEVLDGRFIIDESPLEFSSGEEAPDKGLYRNDLVHVFCLID